MLRYAGGKTRARTILLSLLPSSISQVVSPFLGGGSFELCLASKGIQVMCSDVYSPLMCFWRCMKSNRPELIRRLHECWSSFTKETYSQFQRTLHEGTELDRAVKFFAVNRSCFSGCITGGYSGTRFTPSSIDALANVNLTNITFAEHEYETQLAMYPTLFAFLDPPYDVPNLYGSTKFNHERLAEVLKHRKSDWILCYNDTPRIRRLYEGWTTIRKVSWKYGMNATKTSNEIIISPLHNEVHTGTCNGRQAQMGGCL